MAKEYPCPGYIVKTTAQGGPTSCKGKLRADPRGYGRIKNVPNLRNNSEFPNLVLYKCSKGCGLSLLIVPDTDEVYRWDKGDEPEKWGCYGRLVCEDETDEKL